MAAGNATFANESVTMADGNATFVDRDVFFTDGNAAARTFGRAHRRRPYHFSCGSVSQGCRRGARRWTKREKVAGEVLADGQKREKVAGEVLADGQNQKWLPARCSPTD